MKFEVNTNSSQSGQTIYRLKENYPRFQGSEINYDTYEGPREAYFGIHVAGLICIEIISVEQIFGPPRYPMLKADYHGFYRERRSEPVFPGKDGRKIRLGFGQALYREKCELRLGLTQVKEMNKGDFENYLPD